MKSRRRSKDNKVALDGKKILLVVTGGISAYKSAYLIRLIKRSGGQVRVVMTDAATRFVTPLTFEVLSGNPVQTDIFARREHIELATWPDRVVVAPATADFIGSVASGMAGDLPRAVVCATTAPVYMAPAMNDGMWANPAVKRNIAVLEKDGRRMIAPGSGELACGTSGNGRMAEPEEIMAVIERSFGPGPLKGIRFLVTAGRTIEEIDPVRYISNHSSGRMGFAIASRAMELGAKVTVIHGQVDVPLPDADVIREVRSASQMKTAVLRSLPRCDVLVMAAAVSDFRPSRRAKEKIKKETGIDSIELVKTPDILLAVRDRKKPSQIIVGFALETADGEKNAARKAAAKGCDYMVLNMAGAETGFGTDTNQVTLFRGTRKLETSPLTSKDRVAGMIVDMLAADGRLGKAKR